MASEHVLVSNKRFLMSQEKRLAEALEQFSQDATSKREMGYIGRGDRDIAREEVDGQNHHATNEMLKDTRAALKRMEEGTYGICVDCGQLISGDRLTALPVASRCIKCQRQKGLKIR